MQQCDKDMSGMHRSHQQQSGPMIGSNKKKYSICAVLASAALCSIIHAQGRIRQSVGTHHHVWLAHWWTFPLVSCPPPPPSHRNILG
jgi:hypothetical protein